MRAIFRQHLMQRLRSCDELGESQSTALIERAIRMPARVEGKFKKLTTNPTHTHTQTERTKLSGDSQKQ